MLIELLGYVFLVIFVLTAALTLASIPGWIEIPEEYRKTLFKSLLLEVVGAIVVLFTQSYIPVNEDGAMPKKCYASFGNGLVLALDVEDAVGDSCMFELKNGSAWRILPNYDEKLNVELDKKGKLIVSADTVRLGSVSKESLAKLSLFNVLCGKDAQQLAYNNYRLVKFQKNGDIWVRFGSFLKNSDNGVPIDFQIFESNEQGTAYKIIKGDDVYFNSLDVSKTLFDVDDRVIHLVPQKKSYTLFLIVGANLQSDDKFVHVMQMRLTPTLD